VSRCRKLHSEAPSPTSYVCADCDCLLLATACAYQNCSLPPPPLFPIASYLVTTSSTPCHGAPVTALPAKHSSLSPSSACVLQLSRQWSTCLDITQCFWHSSICTALITATIIRLRSPDSGQQHDFIPWCSWYWSTQHSSSPPFMCAAALQTVVNKHRPRKAFYEPGAGGGGRPSSGQPGSPSRTGGLSPAAQPLGSGFRSNYSKAHYPSVDVQALDLE
jgi:hypothetical protein